ncbi:D-amino-acid oxidase (DAAO) (DAMOX) (DAO) [Durusdinium trenchii]|uniref:D-amino-acid oxidase (DAAO) (DAMOX) (DAO) n=1 Tax=Durusdinium trenchii TaxID=1381693 RepID=A0ABP0N3V9_9DINO
MMEVVVLGGGVIGLTTALQLLRDPRIPSHLQVKVLAKSFEATCSHAAGAWWIPDPSSPASRFAQASESGARYVRWAKETWKEMQDVEHCRMVPGVRLYLPSALQHGELCLEGPNSLQALVQKFQRLDLAGASGAWPGAPVEVVKGFRGLEPPKSGISFETQFTKMDAYLAHLRGELNRSGRCQLLEREVSSLEEVTAAYSNAVAIVNCCGLTAGTLAKDPTMFAARGQTVLVDAPEQTSDQRPVYVLPQGDGTVAVGGCCLPEPRSPDASASRRVPGREGGWQCPELDQQLAEEILRDAQAWCPALRGRPVLRQSVGWRPFRDPAARVERDPEHPKVIHNYGHGDVGVILSWGSAKEVAEILLAMTQSKL